MIRLKGFSVTFLSLAAVLLAAFASPAEVAWSAGGGPDSALVPSNEWQSLNPGEERWYVFYYEGDGSQIDIRLQTSPPESANFAVWTPQDVRQWADGAEVVPVGRGSPDPSAEDTLVWTGSFQIRGAYYLVLEHAGTHPGASYYLLTISGSGVSFQPPATPTATPSPVASSQSAPVAPSEPAGTLVFQTTIGGPIYTIGVDGDNLRRVGQGMDPSWSPDGSQIAFIQWQEPRGVWVMDTDGANARRIFDWSEPRWTSWSPDGQEVMFARVTGGRQEPREFCFRGFCFTFPAHPHWKMGVVRVDDGSFYEPPPPDSLTSRAPMWSPVAAQTVSADIQGLRIQSLDGEVSFLITDDSRDTSPAWSPDGRQVAFVRRQHDHWELYAVNADGGNLRRLTNTPAKPNGDVANSVSPAWSPDGQHLAFLTDRTGKWEIWIMRANGSQQRPMFQDELSGLGLEYTFLGERAISWKE